MMSCASAVWYFTNGKQLFKRESLNILSSAEISIFIALAYGIIRYIAEDSEF
jgi:hypothetical protein